MKLSIIQLSKKALASLATATLFFTNTLVVFAATPELESHDISQKDNGWSIEYCLDSPAKVTVGIYEPEGSTGSSRIAILANKESRSQADCYTEFWDGEYGSLHEDGTEGEDVPEGRYFYGITVYPLDSSSSSDYQAEWFDVEDENDDSNDSSDLRIVDVDLKNGTFDPYEDEEVEFEFTINNDAYLTLEISDEDDDRVTTIVEDKLYKKGTHTLYWDGENRQGDIVDEGEYTYEFIAIYNNERDEFEGKIRIDRDFYDEDETRDPRIKNYYVTKEEFDPGRKERVYIVFTITAEADVNIVIDDPEGRELEEIFDEEELRAGTYAVVWDGLEAVEEDGSYSYTIYAKNSAGSDTESGTIEVDEDVKDLNKPNVYRDQPTKLPFDPKSDYNFGFEFRLENEADITIEVRDRGKEYNFVLATIVEEKEYDGGLHTISWNGKDDYGDYLDDGVYEYKITAENFKGKDIETGYFSIDRSGNSNPGTYERCGGFEDVSDNNKFCDAIEWAKTEGIFQGYPNGTFKPFDTINRVEALKVVLRTLDISLIDNDQNEVDFPDVTRFDWFADFIRTGLDLGIIRGYPDGKFRPGDTVNRAEALVMLLNAAKVKDDVIIPTRTEGQPFYDVTYKVSSAWYISYAWMAKEYALTDDEDYFFPGTGMTRAEMADMLYRYEHSGLAD